MNLLTRLPQFLRQPGGLILVGVVLAFGFLLLDAFVDATFFSDGDQGFLHSLTDPEPMDGWMRAVVFVLMVGFSIYASRQVRRQSALADELQRERDGLAERVSEATEELRLRNQALSDEIERRAKVETELLVLAVTDPLTQLYNRRKLRQDMDIAIAADRRYRTGLAFILCDVDHFKSINDQYGHETGDAVLKQLAKQLRQHTRESDTVARWGGEEFAILTALADRAKAQALAEKLRQILAASVFPLDRSVTASFGVALLTAEDTAETLIRRADQALYAAKGAGRNRVMLAAD